MPLEVKGESAVAMKKVGSAVVIVAQDGRVLLVKHTYGKLNWELPGGAAEANESLEETALRETLEETGLAVIAKQMVGQVYYDPERDMHHFVFVCKPADSAAVPRVNSEEISEWGYWPIDALPRPISDFTVQRIRDATSTHGSPSVVRIGPRQWIE